MQVSRYEQETIINYNAEEKQAEIYTCDPVVKRKLQKLIADKESGYSLKLTDNDSITVVCPKKCIKFRSAKKRELSERQKANLQELAKRLNGNS